MDKFHEIATLLKHDIGTLTAGRPQRREVTVNNIDELKELLTIGMQAPAETPPIATGASSIVDKAHAYVFRGGTLTAADHMQLANVFPMTLSAESLPNKTLAPNEVWDLGTSTTPVVLNLGTLTMESGSSIKIANTVLQMSVQTLIRNAGPGGPVNYDLGIFGATGQTPPAPPQGVSGGPGVAGANGTCNGGTPGDDGKPGTWGGNGGSGNPGLQGGDGLAALTANIVIGSGGIGGTANQFVIYTRSGDGGQGGPGSKGGNGGNGGSGGSGATCGCTHTDGANGGSGGNGGTGGDGGVGGNAVRGNDIYVTVPNGQRAKIITQSSVANPGMGGLAGPGGDPGTGGRGGSGGGASGCPQGSGGTNGNSGSAGGSGKAGPAGTQTGAPGTIYVNESA